MSRNSQVVCHGIAIMVLVCTSCKKPASQTSAPSAPVDAVAVVAGTPIPSTALKAELHRQFRNTEGPLSMEQKLSALDHLIRNEAMFTRAKAEGFDQTPEIQARIKSLVLGNYKERQLARATDAVSEQQIAEFYQANLQRYSQPGAVHGAAIFLRVPSNASGEKRDEWRQQAESVLAAAREAADDRAFAQLVLRHSADQATRYHGGDLGWLTPGMETVDPALITALAGVERPGEFAPLVSTPHGFYVAKLLEKRAPIQKALGEVKEAIRYQLTREKAAQAEREMYASAKAGLDIQINRSMVEAISGPAHAREPQPLPATTTAQLR